MKIKSTILNIYNFLTFRSAKLAVFTSLVHYYEEYECFIKDQYAMLEVLDDIGADAPIESVIKALGDAKTFQRKAIEHIKTCMTLAPTVEEKERLIIELDSIRRHQAA